MQKSLFDDQESELVRAEQAGPIECLGLMFPNDEERRKHFLGILREKLKDPEFRKIEGFPIGSDEDILALSDPPYYTACPNPFIADFIQHYGKPYDPSKPYSREPFAADVSEGKNDPIYNAHSYHTKVPPRAIQHYLEHYTKPGDVVLDGFCGTGMTGVATQRNSNKTARRFAVLCDLSVLPAFIASNLTGRANPDEVARLFKHILREAQSQFGSSYETPLSNGKTGEVQYAVWSDVFLCPNCSEEVVYWNAAIDLDEGIERDPFPCPHCRAELKKRVLERAFTRTHDPVSGNVVNKAKRKMVRITYTVDGKRYHKEPSREDLQKATDLEACAPASWIPSREMPRADRYYKDGLHLVGISHYHHFYFPRALHILGFMWAEIQKLSVSSDMRNRLKFILTSMLDRNLTIRNRFVVNEHNPQGRINGPLANTLYVPGLSVEQNPITALEYKHKDALEAFHTSRDGNVIVSTQSLASMPLPEYSLDYVFIDPPFGHNIMYSELNAVSESWLGILSSSAAEAVVSESQKKGVMEYMSLMGACFSKCHHALKPGRWMTVEFHNSQNAIWNAIQQAITDAGFVIADIRTLDKKKGTINQEFYTSGSVKQDLVISAYKPNGGLEERFKFEAATEEGVWDFVRTHLKQLPVFVSKDGQSENIAERHSYLLFDRMVAFHVQRGVTVPLSAADFYAGLTQRFSERDGMFFLPEQVAEYDQKRMTVREVLQLQLFVTDEASAIQWLKQQLVRKPQTFQEIHPQFLKEIGGWQKHEKPLELSQLLDDTFICYDGKGEVPSQIHSYLSTNFKELRNLLKDAPELRTKGKDRWYVPDPNKAGDMEKKREKALFKEFEEYRTSSQKRLKVFRLEAVRAGFKKAWQERDYATIITVARKIPENVLQEDPKLLMWYDQALTRSGES